MKKSVLVLSVILVLAVLLFPVSAMMESADAIPAADETLSEETEQTEETPVSAAEIQEPDVRWTFGVSLTALQSPYIFLVNQDSPLDKDFEPQPMVKMTMVKRATSATIYLQETCAQALQQMFTAASLLTEYTYTARNSKGEEIQKTDAYKNGMTLYLKSGYRSYGTQATTYANYLARNNNVDDGYVAKPGASEHQSGLCADILNADYASREYMTQDFQYTAEAQWLKENCAQFGFILRFPQSREEETGIRFEPWHFRYVGKEIAGYISSSEMSLEAFTEAAKNALSAFEEKGGDVQVQLAYEKSRLNAQPASFILDEVGTDGDPEISLVF